MSSLLPTNSHITIGMRRALKMLNDCEDYAAFCRVLPFVRRVERLCFQRERMEDWSAVSSAANLVLLRVT